MNLVNRTLKRDVLVVGAGPVGLLSALLLQRKGFTVHVIDEAWRATARSYAAALHQSTQALLSDLGIGLDKLEGTTRIGRVGLYDKSGKRAEIDLSAASSSHPSLLIVPQNRLEALLEEELRKAGVTVEWSHRLARLTPGEQHTEVEVDVLERSSSGYAYATTTVEIARSYDVLAQYVIGADGHSSVVRRQLGIKRKVAGPPIEFDVFEFQRPEKSEAQYSGDEVSVLLDEAHTNVLWRLPASRMRWSFQVEAPESAHRDRIKSRLLLAVPGEATLSTSREVLLDYIKTRAPWFTDELGDIAWAGDVRFEPQFIDQLGRGRVWLVGDAVHQTGPVGIQSMNAGLAEAVKLTDIVATRLRGASDGLSFEDYQASCLKEWRRLLGQVPWLAPGGNADPWLKPYVSRLLSCVPATGSALEVLLGQVGIVTCAG